MAWYTQGTIRALLNLIERGHRMYYVIRSLNMMHYLIRKGFNVQNVSDSNENPELKVFLFTDTPELRKAMSEFTKSKVN